MKLEDILAPYQYDPQNHPRFLDGFETEIKWFGVQRRATIARLAFESRSNEFYVFWRFEDDDGAWCMGEETAPNYLAKIWDKNEAVPERLLQRLRSTIGMKSFCRLLFLPEKALYSVMTPSKGAFYSSFSNHASSASFHLNWGSIKHKRCSEIRQEFWKILANKESDTAFALQFLQSDATTAGALAFGFENRDEYEERLRNCERLLTYALWLSNSLWQSKAVYYLHVYLEKKYRSRVSELGNQIRSVGFQIGNEDEYWIDLIRSFGPLQMCPDRRKKHLSLKRYMTLANASIFPPTAHERLEAKLQLLEWAKTHLPAEKYAEVETMETESSPFHRIS